MWCNLHIFADIKSTMREKPPEMSVKYPLKTTKQNQNQFLKWSLLMLNYQTLKNSCSANVSLVYLLTLQRRCSLASSYPKLFFLCQSCIFEHYNMLIQCQHRGEVLAEPVVFLSTRLRFGVLNFLNHFKWAACKLHPSAFLI